MAQIPLSLKLMSQAYQDISTQQIETIRQFKEYKEHLDYLTDRYIDVMLTRHEASKSGYDRTRTGKEMRPLTIQRLKWLAQQLNKNNRGRFFLEKIQPSWLPSSSWQWVYILVSRLVTSFILVSVLAYGMGITEFIYYPLLAFVGGIIVCFIDLIQFEGYIGTIITKIWPQWDRGQFIGINKRAFHKYGGDLRTFLVIFLVGLSISLFFGLLLKDPSGDIIWGVFSKSGLVLGFFGFFFSLVFRTKDIELSLNNDIQNVKTLKLSPTQFLKGFVKWGSVLGVIVIAIVSVILIIQDNSPSYQWLLKQSQQFFELLGMFWVLGQPLSALAFGFFFGLIVGGSIGGMFTGMEPVITEEEELQSFLGILKSNLEVGIQFTVIFGAIFGLSFWWLFGYGEHIYQGVANGLTLGLVAFFWYGGFDIIKHYSLRLILYGNGQITIPSTDFINSLNQCCDLMFLDKPNVGYQFFHKHLRDYFAKYNNPTEEGFKSNWSTIGKIATVVVLVIIVVFLTIDLNYQRVMFWLQKLPENCPRTCVYERIVVSSDNKKGQAISSPIQVESGDKISIRAGGWLSTGPFVVRVTPNGTEAGFIGIPVSDEFDLVPNLPNGALLCRIGDNKDESHPISSNSKICPMNKDDWCLCGTRQEFSVPTKGFLEFEINDSEPIKHHGAFFVTIQIEKGY